MPDEEALAERLWLCTASAIGTQISLRRVPKPVCAWRRFFIPRHQEPGCGAP